LRYDLIFKRAIFELSEEEREYKNHHRRRGNSQKNKRIYTATPQGQSSSQSSLQSLLTQDIMALGPRIQLPFEP
jgi:hypothetical protein